ncbi:MAG TPA: S53 family peptidase [Bryobacteraceae bacterium]|jgi:subtilase family serine protease|nr:S53 family peptidase [Bryobacteraceae bacterium]
MFFKRPRLYAIFSCAGLLVIGSFFALRSQSTGRRAAPLIHDRVDENKLVTLRGNTRGEATAENDLGAVADGLILDHMMLQLKRSPEQEQAAAQFVDELHNPKSPNFHKWLTASEYGKNYGLADADIQTITGWMESHGFTVNSVYANGMTIDFSGNAGQVRRAFHTEIHNLDVNGARHIANMSDPQIPEALAPAIAGIVSMHDFMPHKMAKPKYTFTYQGQTYWALVPADLATIYDMNPLLKAGTTGSGQTVVVVEDTDLYSSLDWTNFRKTLGLSSYTSGSLTTVHPAGSGSNSCSDPGVNSADDEAALDTEWASAAAPGAAIVLASCSDTEVTFGGFIAMQNLINGSNPPAIMSVSYGNCEAENGASSNASINTLYQQAVMEGTSIFVSSGDEGAASCDAGLVNATHGIGVSAYASTPYNVAVGGTDFSDVVNGTTGKYWSRTNTTTYGSAQSYIPEIPWNDSCAGSLLAGYMGYTTVYGPNGFCGSAAAQNGGFVAVAGGSGGPSNCATGAPTTYGVSGGTCQGYAKPSWQTGLSGIPNDGVRDIPDVSMFAADGVWGHYAVVCFSDQSNNGSPCTGAPIGWAGYGGTSLAAPIMAGIQALVNQKMGGAQGNPNYVYYAMAASTPSAFNAITTGDIDQNCSGAVNCYGVLGTVVYGRGGRVFGTTWGGALSVSSGSFTPAYAASPSWNFATGIGSIDVNNLVTNWQ